MCMQDSSRSLILHGPDYSWVAQEARGSPRTSSQTAHTLLSYSLLVVTAVPLLLSGSASRWTHYEDE
jgi:hypothetical protein